VYPAIRRPDHQGWIKVRWAETETGCKAKFYSLTSAGRAQLKEEVKQWNRLSGTINAVIQTL
jgi:PadR family transcriptional regulator, regulatory protein PadR